MAIKRGKSDFIWCHLSQSRKALGKCPECQKFPCRDLSKSDLAHFENDDSFILSIIKIEKRKVAMIFLLDTNNTLTKFSGKIESLNAEQEQATEKIFDVAFYYEQKMTWIAESKAREESSGTETESKIDCIVENKDGTILRCELDPSIPIPEAAKIYPIKTILVKYWKPIKIKIEESNQEKTPKRKKSEN
jgi:hypothetical protein